MLLFNFKYDKINIMKELVYYLIFINIFTFIIFGIDKYKAIKNKYRVKEKTLFILSIIGGFVGAILAMKIFRHKTLKPSFKYGIPIICIIELIIIFVILRG